MKSRTSDNAMQRGMLAISPYNQLALLQLLEGRGPIQIFDTTLRDGEQAPGIALSPDDKFRIAMALDDLGVDYMEAGFAVSSDIERETIRRIVDAGTRAEVVTLARSVEKDIDAAAETGARTVHTFIGTSPLHRDYKLRMSKEEIIESAVGAVEYARSYGMDVQFSCEDATRTELDYMIEVYRAAVDAGASVINVPDTVGVITPRGMSYLIGELVKGIDVPISVHCHNDMGLAVANTMAAMEAGATIAQCTVNGIGERTGNASLEEVAVNLFANYDVDTVDLSKIGTVCRTVERITGFPMAFNKPIVGRNAFAHESGIHVHGVMNNSATYEPFLPTLVGVDRQIVIGKHSGAHSVSGRLEELGIEVPENLMDGLMTAVKEAAVGDKEIDDAELRVIADHVLYDRSDRDDAVVLDGAVVFTGKGVTSTATLEVTVNGEARTIAETGVGPVDAATKAIFSVVGGNYTLEEFKLAAINGKSSALCEVTVMVRNRDREGTGLVTGKAIGTDIVRTSIDALVAAINRDFARE